MHNLGAYSYMCITLLWSVLPGICNLPTTFQVRPYTMGAASSAALGVVSPPEGQSIVHLSLPLHFITSRELLLFLCIMRTDPCKFISVIGTRMLCATLLSTGRWAAQLTAALGSQIVKM